MTLLGQWVVRLTPPQPERPASSCASFYSVAAACTTRRAQGLNGRRGWAALHFHAHERSYLRSSFAPLIWSIAAETARSICR